MNGDKVIKINDGAYIVPSYSMQSITPGFDLFGTVHVVGATEVDEQEGQDGDEFVADPVVIGA